MSCPVESLPQSPTASGECFTRRRLAAAVATVAIVAAGCGAATAGPAGQPVATPSAVGVTTTPTTTAGPNGFSGTQEPERLAMADAQSVGSTPSTVPPKTPHTEPPPIPFGSIHDPFVALPDAPEARAIMTPSGVVLPVIDERENSWLVSTVCQNIRFVSDATPIGRAHVVLDPGHGGREVGATSPDGIRESDLNLAVATRAADLLTDAGATVVLTRTGDYTVTAASRGHIAKAIKPGLLVSVHHNGGAPPTDDRPGTLVYTKTDSPDSSRFGGLFYQAMQPMLTGAAEPKHEAYRAYAEALDAYEAQIAAHDESAIARDAVLVANGQLPAEAAITSVPTTTVAPGDYRIASQRQLPTTTTLPISAAEPVPIPDSLPLPEPFLEEPVRKFRWAGAGNSGVRSWTRADGKDYLAVLRHSGDVPAALAEFLYVTNPSEAELLADPAFIEKEAGVLADAVILYFTTDAVGTGFVADQYDDQPIGGSGSIASCREPKL